MKYIIIFLLFISYPFTISAFSDIENNWYKSSVLDLKDLWIINGYDDGTYLPENKVSRAEILKIIMNAAWSEVQDTQEICFIDVPLDTWYAKYVCSWVKSWITNWYPDGTFDPDWEITVLETLAFAGRAFDIDLEYLWEGDTWYQKYQAHAHLENIIPKHAYTIDTLASRWQAAQIINNMRIIASGQNVDYKSIWCSVDPSLTSGSYTLNINGSLREYLLYVPSGMKQNKEMSLAVAFHGRTNSNEMVRDYMQLGWWAYGYKQNDFIVAYPAAAPSWPYSWFNYSHIEFFDAIITEISEKLCINRDEVFTVGHSLGSYMSNKVSCQRWDVIRAMAWVASDGFNGECSGPVSSLITHLSWDPLASYSWGQRAYRLKSEQNYCEPEEISTSIWDIRSCVQKNSCTLWNTVLFCNSYATYGNDQHSWPKEWSDDILDFFRDIEEYSK